MASKRQRSEYSLAKSQSLPAEQKAANNSALLRLPPDLLLKIVDYVGIVECLAVLPRTGRATMQSGYTPEQKVEYRISAHRSPIKELTVSHSERHRWFYYPDTIAKVVRAMRLWATNVTRLDVSGGMRPVVELKTVLPNLETLQIDGYNGHLTGFWSMALAAFPKWTSCTMLNVTHRSNLFREFVESKTSNRAWRSFDMAYFCPNDADGSGFDLDVMLRLANPQLEKLSFTSPTAPRSVKAWTLDMTKQLAKKLSPKVFRHLELPWPIQPEEADPIVTCLLDTFPTLSTLQTSSGSILVSESVWLRAVSQWPDLFETFPFWRVEGGLQLANGKLSNDGIATLVGQPHAFRHLVMRFYFIPSAIRFFESWDAKQIDALLRSSSSWSRLDLHLRSMTLLPQTWKWIASLPQLTRLEVWASYMLDNETLDALAEHASPLERLCLMTLDGKYASVEQLSKKPVQRLMQRLQIFRLQSVLLSSWTTDDWKQVLTAVDECHSPNMDELVFRVPATVAQQVSVDLSRIGLKWITPFRNDRDVAQLQIIAL